MNTKTVMQILQRFSEQSTPWEDAQVFAKSALLQFVPYKMAFQHVDYRPTPAEWSEYYRKLTRTSVVKVIEQYMKYAWARVLDERGLAAQAAIAHFRVWFWILDVKKVIRFLDDPRNYPCHGAPMLRAICEYFKWDYRKYLPLFKAHLAEKFLRGEGC